MAYIATPFNDLEGQKTTGGTWTLETVGGPAAPGSYNGTISFSTEAEGEYTYAYTVTSGTSTDVKRVTYDWRGVRIPRVNAACTNAAFIASPVAVPFEIVFSDDSLGDCETKNGPTTSADPPATEWGTPVGGFSGDLWYTFYPPSYGTDYNIILVVDGAPYGDESISSVAVEIMRGTDCGSILERSAAVSPGYKTATVAISFPFGSYGQQLYFRVASYAGGEGKFDLKLYNA